MYHFVFTAHPYLALGNRIGGAFAGLGMLSFYGLKLLYKGVNDDIYDWIGEKNAPRWFYIAAGIFFQLPLIAFILFLSHQGLLP
jgi:hypothetical protein